MLGKKPDMIYEGIWDVKSAKPIDEDTILVTYITAWFDSEKASTDPTANCVAFGPEETCINAVKVDVNDIPEIQSASDSKTLYQILTEKLKFDKKQA